MQIAPASEKAGEEAVEDVRRQACDGAEDVLKVDADAEADLQRAEEHEVKLCGKLAWQERQKRDKFQLKLHVRDAENVSKQGPGELRRKLQCGTYSLLHNVDRHLGNFHRNFY